MSEQAWSWGISALVHGALMVAAFAWPVAPEPEPLWQEVELRAVVMERLEIPAPYIAPEPEPEPEEEAASEAAGGERSEEPASEPERKPRPEPVKARRAKVREAAPVVVERTEEAAASVAAPVDSAPVAPAEAVAMATDAGPPRHHGPRGGSGGGGAQDEPVGLGGGVDRDGLLKAYRRALYKAVDGRKQYPAMARRARLSGVVHVSVVVDGRGKILEVGVERSSGHALLDEAACEAVRGLGAMPAPPDGLEWARQKIVIPVKYVG